MSRAADGFADYLRHQYIAAELLFRQQPLVLFQLVAFAVTGAIGPWSYAVLLASLVFAMLLTHALLIAYNARCRAAVLQNLRTFPGDVTAYRLRDIFPPEQLAGVGDMIFFRMGAKVRNAATGLLSRQTRLDQALDEVRIFVREPAPGHQPSTPFVAFPLRLCGYIFLRDHPADLHGTARFMLYHELGHMSLLGNYEHMRSRIAYAPFLLTAYVAATQLAPGTAPVVALAVYYFLILQLLLKPYLDARAEQGEFTQEHIADCISLATLDIGEAQRASEVLRKRHIADTNLHPDWEAIRHLTLQDNLDEIDQGRPRGIRFAPPSGRTPIPVWITLGATVALAFFTRPFDRWAAAGLAVAGLAILAFLAFSGWRSVSLARAIDKEARSRAPAVPRETKWVSTSPRQRRKDMSDDQRIARILSFTFPDEADTLGPGTLSDIVRGNTSFAAPKEGKRFDIPWEVIQKTAAVIALIRATIDVTRYFWGMYKRVPSVAEAESELARRSSSNANAATASEAPAAEPPPLTAAERSRVIGATIVDLQADLPADEPGTAADRTKAAADEPPA